MRHAPCEERWARTTQNCGGAISLGYISCIVIRPSDLNLRHLLAVVAIARRGSMGAAAEAVSLTQPALTQGLAKLEAQLCLPLFLRRSDGMIATAEGLVIVERVERAFALLAGAMAGPGRGFARPERLVTSAQLRALIALADTGSFLAAAERTGLSQPAIHRSVRELEQILSSPLAERKGRGVALTSAGRRAARGARLAIGEIASAIAELTDSPHSADPIVIGAMPLCRARLLPRALNAFTDRFPEARLKVVEGSWQELVEPLRDGVIDLMIGALRDQPAPVGLEQHPLFDDRLVVVARPAHPLVGSARPSMDQLSSYPWIIGPAGSPLVSHWAALFEGRSLPRTPIECGSVMTIRQMLRESDMLTLLSPEQVAVEVDAGLLAHVGLPLPQCVRTIGVTTRAFWRPTTAQRQLLVLLDSVATERRLYQC